MFDPSEAQKRKNLFQAPFTFVLACIAQARAANDTPCFTFVVRADT
jgi:hypothetical protein